MGRVAFVLFLVFSMPIGIHHLFADPHVGAGFKFVHAVFTAMVAVHTMSFSCWPQLSHVACLAV